MLKLAWALGLRFFRAKRRAVLSRFMSRAATAGIAVGVFALITGLSAMNGFERELKQRVLAVVPSAQLTAQDAAGFANAGQLAADLTAQPGITAATQVLELEAVFASGTDFVPGLIYGIDPAAQAAVSNIGLFTDVAPDVLAQEPAAADAPLPVILGAGIARQLQVERGSTLRLLINRSDTAGASGQVLFKSPQNINLQVAGIFRLGGQLDSTLAFAYLPALASAAGRESANQIQLRTADLLHAGEQARQAAMAVPHEPALVLSWLGTQGKLYHDIEMIRGLMYLAMILVMAVACFNIVSTLITTVTEKQREIAILLTMGAGRMLIMTAFCIMGLLSGLRGIVLGLITGCTTAWFLTDITDLIEQLFGFKILNEEIYFISFIPTQLSINDVMLVFACALLMSLAASIYPAFRASRQDPASQLGS